MDYRIVKLDSNDLKDLRFLYSACFNSSPPVSYFTEKYNTGYTGVFPIGYIAYDKSNIPAAYYGVFPCIIEYKGQKILAAQSGDTMTHPNHQGKGLFTLLATKTYISARDNGIKFVFGFPNKNSYPGFIKKLNWAHKEDIREYYIQVATFPLAKLVKKMNFLSPLYRLFYRLFFSSYDLRKNLFPNSVLKNSQFGGLYRDKNYAGYKSYGKSFIVRINKRRVWIKIDGAFWIGDIDICTQSELIEVLKIIKRKSFLIGADKIVFYVSPNTYFHDLFSEMNIPFKTHPIGFLDLGSGIAVENIKYTSSDFDTF